MSEKPEADEFEDEVADDLLGNDEVDVDRAMRDMDLAKKRGQKMGDPIWRRLERLREEKHTAELVSDFEDYDIGLDDEAESGEGGSARRRKRRSS